MWDAKAIRKQVTCLKQHNMGAHVPRAGERA